MKQRRDSGFFLGCTNYKADGTGCNKAINKKTFYDQMGYEIEKPENMYAEKPVEGQQEPKKQETKKQEAKKQVTVALPGKQSTADRALKDDFIEINLAEDIRPVMYGNYELNHLLFTVVKALQNVSKVRYYGVTVLAEVLKGIDSRKIVENKLDKLPEFGADRDYGI